MSYQYFATEYRKTGSEYFRAYPSAILYEEAYTGTKIDRPKFKTLLRLVKPGDTIVFDEVSRMSRNAEEGFELYKELYDKGVELVFLKSRISIRRHTGNIVLPDCYDWRTGGLHSGRG